MLQLCFVELHLMNVLMELRQLLMWTFSKNPHSVHGMYGVGATDALAGCNCKAPLSCSMPDIMLCCNCKRWYWDLQILIYANAETIAQSLYRMNRPTSLFYFLYMVIVTPVKFFAISWRLKGRARKAAKERMHNGNTKMLEGQPNNSRGQKGPTSWRMSWPHTNWSVSQLKMQTQQFRP
jgi:hypothetical protein